MPIVIEPKKKPPTRRKEKMAKSSSTKRELAIKKKRRGKKDDPLLLARKRKPTGRLNRDDLERVMKSLGLKGMGSDALKANAAMLKKQFGKRKSIQSKGPVGTGLKKVSKLGK